MNSKWTDVIGRGRLAALSTLYQLLLFLRFGDWTALAEARWPQRQVEVCNSAFSVLKLQSKPVACSWPFDSVYPLGEFRNLHRTSNMIYFFNYLNPLFNVWNETKIWCVYFFDDIFIFFDKLILENVFLPWNEVTLLYLTRSCKPVCLIKHSVSHIRY